MLSTPQGATIADGTGVGTIVDDDAPSVSIADASVTEGDLGPTVATFTLTLSAPSTLPISVGYQTTDGTASSLSDYAAASGTADFDPGETTAEVTVLVQGDVLSEADETFAVDLNHPVNVGVGDGHGVGTIDDDDPLPSLSVGDASVVEGSGGTTPMTYTVTLSPASGQTVTVDYSTADGTATAPGDYQPKSGTLMFAPGQTSKTVTVLVQGDATFEPTETLALSLSNPVDAAIDAAGRGTISDDDVPISIAGATVPEGNSGTLNAVIAVTLGGASANTVTVDYSTFDGSASAPDDYAATSGTLTFTPGQTAKQILVPVNGDTTVETNEIFTVNPHQPVEREHRRARDRHRHDHERRLAANALDRQCDGHRGELRHRERPLCRLALGSQRSRGHRGLCYRGRNRSCARRLHSHDRHTHLRAWSGGKADQRPGKRRHRDRGQRDLRGQSDEPDGRDHLGEPDSRPGRSPTTISLRSRSATQRRTRGTPARPSSPLR